LLFCSFSSICFLSSQTAQAVNTISWEAANSLVDTTNYNGLAPYFWFANFNNTTAVTGAPMDDHEARNLPSWLHLETRPGCIGMADDCTTADSTNRTGFSFTESPPNGSTSIGGQTLFNMLTLPDGSSGISGEAVDSVSGVVGTSSMLAIRVLDGAPSSIRMWVVTDNGTGPNYHDQIRMRVNLRDNTVGPPDWDDSGDMDQVEAEAMPSGQRIGNTPEGHNGIADAWAFRLDGVNLHDIITVRPTALGGIPGDLSGFAGIMIQVIPEPSSAMLLLLSGIGFIWTGLRRR
jgi:hypothetical protein